MKHLKTFESINRPEIIDKFTNSYKYNTGYGWWQDDVKYKMTRYNFPEEFKDEFCLLYFMYTNSSWRSYEKSENNQIKRVVKKHISDNILKKLENDVELYFKLMEMYKKTPKWDQPASRSFGAIGDVNIKHIYMVFNTITSKFGDVFSDYNL